MAGGSHSLRVFTPCCYGRSIHHFIHKSLASVMRGAILATLPFLGDNRTMHDISSFPLLQYLDPSDVQLVEKHLVLEEYPAQTTIFDSSSCKGVMAVVSGIVRVYMLSEEGREITLYRLFEGDFCMLSVSCLMGTMPLQAIIRADTNCRLALLSNDIFSGIHRRNPRIQQVLLSTMTSRLADVMWVVEQVAFKGMDRRIGGFLLSQPASVIYATHEAIASELGTAREVVSRMLKYFERNGIISLSRGKLKIIDRPALERLAAD